MPCCTHASVAQDPPPPLLTPSMPDWLLSYLPAEGGRREGGGGGPATCEPPSGLTIQNCFLEQECIASFSASSSPGSM